MRSYATNSPEAAARIVALTMLADGHVSPSELEAAHQAALRERLGIDADDLHHVLMGLCEDLLLGAEQEASDVCSIDPLTIERLLAEVEDPRLRQQVLSLCLAVAEADERVCDGEALVLTQAVAHWGLQAHMFDEHRRQAA